MKLPQVLSGIRQAILRAIGVTPLPQRLPRIVGLASDRALVCRRAPTIVRDMRPILKRKILVIPPSRRPPRIVAYPKTTAKLDYACPPAAAAARRRRRPPRLIARA